MSEISQSEKIWYSFLNSDYQGDIPEFFDDGMFAWIDDLEADIEMIKKETQRLIDDHPNLLAPYFNPDLVDKEGSWKTLVFYFWSLRNEDVLGKSPFFDKLLERIPGLTSAAISKLESGTEIGWHIGDTNGVVRCHLPIVVPASLPVCGFEVGEEQRSWEEGKMLLFCDAHRHRAFNHSGGHRIVLIVDVIHPYFENRKKSIVSNALSIMWMQKNLLRFSCLKKMPRFVHGMMRKTYVFFLYFYLPFKQRKKKHSIEGS